MVDSYLNPPVEMPRFNQVQNLEEVIEKKKSDAFCIICEFFDIQQLGGIDNGN